MARSALEDPLKNSNFRIEIDGFVRAGFTEMDGLTSETEVIEYREGGDPAAPRKSPGNTSYSDVVLKRGLLAGSQPGSFDMDNWLRAVHAISKGEKQSMDYRRDVDVVIKQRDGKAGARYRLYNAWPSQCTTPSLNASGSETAVEQMTITYEGFERVQ
jgi:phage tail-like protein